MRRKLFCEYGPTCYKISLYKEYVVRDIKDMLSKESFADEKSSVLLRNVVKAHRSLILRKLNGVDFQLQKNKLENLRLAIEKIDSIIIRPGQTFSFWKLVGKPTRKKGYLEGLTIKKTGPSKGVGGGLCQLANMIHWLVLNSPLCVTEIHHHSDALFPDEKRRVPFGTGTSIFYKNIDYRFKNNTDVDIQLVLWIDGEDLCGELRSSRQFDYKYRLAEKDHYFSNEGNIYYRNSKVYKQTYDRMTNILVKEELVLNNHSKVLYDYDLIPVEQIR